MLVQQHVTRNTTCHFASVEHRRQLRYAVNSQHARTAVEYMRGYTATSEDSCRRRRQHTRIMYHTSQHRRVRRLRRDGKEGNGIAVTGVLVLLRNEEPLATAH